MSFRRFVPFDVLSFRRFIYHSFFLSSFFPFQVLSVDVCYRRRFLLRHFVGEPFFQPCRLVTTDLVLLELEEFYTDEDASKGEGLVMSVGVAHITAINDDEAAGARHRPLFCNLTPLIKGVKNWTTTMLS
jgi:hypothetical protein